MCKNAMTRNGTIYAACRDKLRKLGRHTNTEMRVTLCEHNGCLDPKTAKALMEVAAQAANNFRATIGT